MGLTLVGAGGCSESPATDLDAAGEDSGTEPVDGGRRDSGRVRDGGSEDDGGRADDDGGSTDVDGGADQDAGAGDDGGSEVDAGPGDVDAGTTDAGPIDLDPTCVITAPLDGTAQDYDADFTFVATANDPEDGALSGASITWRSSLVVAPLGSGLSTNARLAPGTHVISCTATDSAGNTGSDSISVTSRSPVAEIWHPGDGETRPTASAIPFSGRGRDFEDGMLTGASLVWTTSVAGVSRMIGTGQSFNALLLPGTNIVTLTVTDSGGNTRATSITLTITP